LKPWIRCLLFAIGIAGCVVGVVTVDVMAVVAKNYGLTGLAVCQITSGLVSTLTGGLVITAALCCQD
jgi:hypothetical protein